MAVNLGKGEKVSLSKEPGLTKVVVGLGWNPNQGGGFDFDLDASAFLLGSNGRVRTDGDFVFYNNSLSTDGSVEGAEDDRTGGSSDEDDEQITVNLGKVSSDVAAIAFSATIHEAAVRNQNFGQVEDAYIRVVNAASDSEIVRYDLSGDFSSSDAVVLGELRREGGSWEFRALGEGISGGLAAVARKYGVNV